VDDVSEALEGTKLMGAKLKGVNLMGAELKEAKLMGANLEHANLKGATADSDTVWPNGFKPEEAGVEMKSP
jgi:uncharacterized protein YjbI with pentapeptide repeats